MRAQFTRQHRLNQAQDFRRAFQQGRRLRQACLVAQVVTNCLAHGRLGLIVPKKIVKLSTRRHRLKRIIRESFRLNQSALQGLDIVIRLTHDQSSDEILLWKALNSLWGQIGAS